MNKVSAITPISLDYARLVSPAAFATSPAPTIKSAKYQFTPTYEVINHMGDLGFQLTGMKQSKSNVPLRKNFGIHIARFQHPDLYIKSPDGGIEARPEVVMINSHDGTRPVQFEMGLFRLVCENGLIVKTQDFGGFRERHTKYDFNTLKSLIDDKINTLKPVVGKISKWAERLMTDKERFQFAVEALALRMGEDRQPDQSEIYEILSPKRQADDSKTLWHTFNVVQENLIKGGFQMNERQARAITNPVEDFRINQDLWQLADVYAC
jgi:hypothetical protein